MCGIVGISCGTMLAETDRDFVANATKIISHRGPDGQGLWFGDQVGFGHRRLAIIDLAGGAQPMCDATGRYSVTFNGEIYNYKELREFLESKQYKFLTNSDTEVILNAFAEWGTACVKHFNGIFAFGLWDAEKRTLFLARDHLGIKPMLYYADQERIIFGSEIKAILLHPEVPREIDPFAISDYLSLGYILAPKTIIKNIRKLPPAMWLLWKDGNVYIDKYWDLAAIANQPPRHFASIRSAAEELSTELDRAVQFQLVSDVPLGAFLSGGIDSSTIVQRMASFYPHQVKTFSIGFNEKSYSELPYARLMATHLGTEHFEQIISPDIQDSLPQLVWYFDEPFSDTSAVPTTALCEIAKRHVKVALSGDGGDECFAGYDTYVADKLQFLYNYIPSFIHRHVITPLVARIPSTHHKVSWDYKIKQFVAHAQGTPEESHYSWRLLFSEAEKQKLWGEDSQRQLEGYTPFEVFMQHYSQVKNASPLNRALYVDAKTWLSDAMLTKVDRASMANGLEVRVPLLDFRLVEFAMSLPADYKLRGFRTKAILKLAMEESLPKSIVYRSKRGFNAPVAHWIDCFSFRMSEYKDEVLPGLASTWSELMREHTAHRADNGFKLWTLLMWSLWSQSVLRGELQ